MVAHGLTRRAPRLLKQVAGKPHAREEDHEGSTPETILDTPTTDEDIFREPESSSDSEIPASAHAYSKSPGRPSLSSTLPSSKPLRESVGEGNKQDGRSNAVAPAVSAEKPAEQYPKKRPSQEFIRDDSFDPFGTRSGMDRPAKKPRRTFSGVSNIHAPRPKARPTLSSTSALLTKASRPAFKQRKTFGSGSGRSTPATQTDDDEDDFSEVSLEPLSPKSPRKTRTKVSPQKSRTSTGRVNKSSPKASPRGRMSALKERINANASATFSRKMKTASKGSPSKPTGPSLMDQISALGGVSIVPPKSSASPLKPSHLDPFSSGNSTPLSSAAPTIDLEPLSGDEDGQFDDTASDSPTACCPYCDIPVDPSLLATFAAANPSMGVRTQMRFCREHKRVKALKQYRENGYPLIDWACFPSRLEKYYPDLRDILLDTTPSFFRTQLEQKVAKGEDRTLISEYHTDAFMKSSITGYYGSRGARAMMECIMAEFADLVRERAVHDQVVSFGGVGNFVQRVLVPELSVRLIQEDLGVGEGSAREVLWESGGVGELVNEELEDEVRGEEEELENDGEE